MKKLLKLGQSLFLWACTCVGAGIITLQAATLQWNTNPEPDIAFYTVYAESAAGTVSREVAGTQLLLDGWLTSGGYTFYVTATSSAGLESDRSLGMPYDFGTIAAPVITTQPSGKLLTSGSTLTMSVTATSASAATYQWRKDGLALTGQTSANFSKSNISVSDSGVYTVVVSNAGGSVTSSPAQVVVQVPPSISSHPLSSSVPAGSSVTLSVSASGTALRYQWFKDGGALSGRTNSSFSIASMTAADQGTYRAVVTNLVGSATSATATLGLILPPTILAGPAGTNVATGGTILLTATVSGTAPFTYQWIKDSQPIANATGSQWLMTGASSVHSGSYQVRVSNAAGSVTSAAAMVSVLDRPTIATQPASKDVLMGAGFTLSVVAQGSGVLSYQWYFNDLPLAGATSASYQVPSASAGNAGAYKVTVANVVGSVTSQVATVRVFPRITIVQQPASTTLQVGGQLTLAVQATGPTPLSFQWYRGTVALSGATNPQLQIAQVSSTDAGSYTVEISSVVEKVTSTAARVTISGSAPSIVAHPQSTQVVQGGQLQISVTASGTGLAYQWLKNETAIPGAVNATYVIASFSSSDQGNYRVRVSNSLGSVVSEIAVVTMIVPPTIAQSPVSTNLATGGTIQLSVVASGTAPLTYQWLKNSQTIVSATGSQFGIPIASVGDSGSYQVRISNAAGSVTSAAAVVSVLDRPSIVTQPASKNVLNGAPLSLSVVAQGSDPLSYQWYLNDAALSGATSSTFQVASASAANAGAYKVIVSNPVGSVTSQVATVQVFPRISIVQQPVGTNVPLGGELNLAVQATGPAGLNYQWYRETVALNGATNAQLQIAQVSSDQAGSYTVDISNALERVSSSAALVTVVTVSGEAPTILSQPIGGDYLEGTNLTLTVKASSPSPITYQWFLNDSAISGATDSKYQKSPAQTADSGSYTVRVANSNGAVNSAPASVLVLQPIVIVQSPTSTNVAKGGRITLSVDATGPAGMTYQWFLNGSKLNGKTSSSLTVSSASLADGGIYTCQITSPVQTLTTPGAEVIVIDLPGANDCALTLSVSGDGSLVISGVAPANTNYELQRSDSLTAPNWTRLQNVSSRAEGRFQVTVPMGTAGTGFIRTVRRAN
jgi:hypothetical protein